ncbi:MAG: hypothetical protein R2757_05890 [Draconibacterium sp.]
MKPLKILVALFVVLLFSQGCATVFGGKTNTLIFSKKSLPKAEIYIDGKLIGEAPGKIKIPKEKIQHGSILVIKAEGYEDQEYKLIRKQNAAYSVVDILIGGIPLAVDYSTGNIYRPNPRTFEYELKKQN